MLLVLCVSLLVVSLDTTVLNVALPTLVRDLHATDTQLQWIVDAYAIAFGGLLLALGSLGDRFGRKWLLLLGLTVFVVGSAGSAFSGSAGVLISTRVVMGIGAAAIMPGTLSILTNTFTDSEERARAIGIWSGTTGLGIAIGPIVGGWLLAHFWWGSVFLINVPIGILGAIAVSQVVPNSSDPVAKKADPLGTVGSVVGFGLLLWGIIEAPQRSWTSPVVVGAMATGLVVLAGFVAWEYRCDHPMLDLSIFRARRFSAAMGSMSMIIFVLMGSLFLLTQYLQFSLGYSAFRTGLLIGPVALVLFVMSPLSTLLVRLLGTKVVVAAGMTCIATGMVLLSRTTLAGSYENALPAFLLLGGGTGLAFAPITDSVMGSLRVGQAGLGAATNGTAIQLGGALGVAVLGSLLNTRYQDRVAQPLQHHRIPSNVLHEITGSLGGALTVAAHLGRPLSSQLSELARSAFVSGLDLSSLVGAVVVGLGVLLVVLALPSRPRPRAVAGASREKPKA
jgi:EmrB/QacA subfamily drug resistance transporter